MTKKMLSIVVVTYNSAKDIESCLSSIKFQKEGNGLEVIVVDNASTDETVHIVNKFPKVKLIRNPKNLGFARANNQGVAVARGEYLLFLNPDTKLKDDTLKILVEFLDQHPDVAAVAPRLLNFDGSQQLSIRSLPTFRSVLWEMTGLPRLFPKWRSIGHWRLRYFDYEQFSFVEQPMASCLLIRKAILVELGGFDESFPIYYNDVDLAFRMREKGYKIGYLPQAQVYHKVGSATSHLKPKMIFETHRSLFKFFKKHTQPVRFWFQAVLLLPLLEFSAVMRVFVYRFKSSLSRRARDSA